MKLATEDAAIFETTVAPRYLAPFVDQLLPMIASGPDARVCHLHCRTGFPDAALAAKLPNAHVYGCDPSKQAIELARAKANATSKGDDALVFDYRVVDGFPLPFPPQAFSHAFTIHPPAAPRERVRLVEELARVTAPLGQVLVALPLRGSFAEIFDLLRECALKLEIPGLAEAVEAAVLLRPTEEMLRSELAEGGFDYVDVRSQTSSLAFRGGRGFFDDPIARLVLLPEIEQQLGLNGATSRAFDYVRDAIDKYWSDAELELTLNAGVVSGRRRALG